MSKLIEEIFKIVDEVKELDWATYKELKCRQIAELCMNHANDITLIAILVW